MQKTPPRERRTGQAQPPPSQFLGDVVAWAMWLYYVEGRTQEAVARTLSVSRATVANYLSEARRRGLVTISVDPHVLAENALSHAVRERFGLKDVHVVPGDDADEAPEALRARIGLAGARVLKARLRPGARLGVAWGRTVLNLAQALAEDFLPDLQVLQVSGSSLGGEQSSPEFCTALIANRLGARCTSFHAPAVISTGKIRDSLLAEPGIARHMRRIGDCDVVLFGVGEVEPTSVFADEDFMDPNVFGAYIERGAVGVMVGRFIGAEGREIEGPLSGRRVGISLDALRAAPERLMVAGGRKKHAAVEAALRGGFATHLVTDAGTAEYLAQGCREKNTEKGAP